MTQSIEEAARGIAADVWEQSVRRWREQGGENIDEHWIRSTRAMFMRGVYDGDRDYIAALAGIKLGREQAAGLADGFAKKAAKHGDNTANIAGTVLAQGIRALT